MLTKGNIEQAKKYCCEDISLIENYEQAINDDNEETIWHCHHRLGIELNKNGKELEAMGLYWNRPACELIFLTNSEHKRLHDEQYWTQENCEKQSERIKKICESPEYREKRSNIAKNLWQSQEFREKHSKAVKGENNGMYGKHHSQETLNKISSQRKIKYKWLTSNGEIKIMNKTTASRYHKDWTLIGPVL